jgi:hypothetical protein
MAFTQVNGKLQNRIIGNRNEFVINLFDFCRSFLVLTKDVEQVVIRISTFSRNAVLEVGVSCVIALCSLLEVHLCFRGADYTMLQPRRRLSSYLLP